MYDIRGGARDCSSCFFFGGCFYVVIGTANVWGVSKLSEQNVEKPDSSVQRPAPQTRRELESSARQVSPSVLVKCLSAQIYGGAWWGKEGEAWEIGSQVRSRIVGHWPDCCKAAPRAAALRSPPPSPRDERDIARLSSSSWLLSASPFICCCCCM